MTVAKHARILPTIPFLIAICFVSLPAHAKYAGGTGEPNDPYLIYTAEHLNAIGAEPNDWDKHFKLMEDLDLAGVSFGPIGRWDADKEDRKPFTGVFNGNKKTIANFTATGSTYVGLFRYVSGVHAEIKDLTLIDPNIENSSNAGSLVGYLDVGTVRDCNVVGGHVSARQNGTPVGGLIGWVRHGYVEKCTSTTDVRGGVMGNSVGGLIGLAQDSVVEKCHSSSNVSGKTNGVGGLVGTCENHTLLTNCRANGTVNGRSYVGGLAGCCYDQSAIAGCYANCDVTGGIDLYGDYVGGLVGQIIESRMICCYATGNVSGDSGIGGLAGYSLGSYIVDSYATGRASGTDENVGGFLGQESHGLVYNCFWDIESSQVSTSARGTGLTTAEMHEPNTFANAGWDFVGESTNGPSDIWIMPDGGGYPILSWQMSPPRPIPTFSGGTGEPEDPFIITTPEELNSIGHNPRLMAAHFNLANDIDLDNIDFFLIGHEGYPFSGVFNGSGHSITTFSHLATPKYREMVGLFRYVRGSKAEIRNVQLVNPSVTVRRHGDVYYVGSLAGQLYDGALINCYAEDGEVSSPSGNYVGGLVGGSSGVLEACSSTTTTEGSFYVGGLLGINSGGILANCDSSSSVSPEFHYGGGIAGINYGLIIACNTVGTVTPLRYNTSTVGGLVGGNFSVISGCTTWATVSGYDLVGGLAGENLGVIDSCCSYGTVEGDKRVGGLVGVNVYHISNSYASGPVSGNDKVGGLVGENTHWPNIAGSITSSYSTSSVSGNDNVGGLVGYRGDARATTGEDCFWDIETSGQTTSDGGVGLTTSEMQTASTFLDAGWDFVDETANGTEDIWWILEGQDYPKLWWQMGDEAP